MATYPVLAVRDRVRGCSRPPTQRTSIALTVRTAEAVDSRTR
jgi:hypothetical protein